MTSFEQAMSTIADINRQLDEAIASSNTERLGALREMLNEITCLWGI